MNRPNHETDVSPAFGERQRADLALTQSPLEQARTLPPWTYTDAAFYAAEEKYVLRREWLSVGRVDDIPEAGDYFTTNVLREPLIIVRGEDGEIRALSAVCRHRAMVIASGRGNAGRFTCPYHTWSYDLNGRLVAAPKMQGNTAFKKKDCALPTVRTEIWQGWIFINFDPDAAPLAPRLKALDEVLAPYRLSELKNAFAPLALEQHYNWKLLAPDNWENYHVLGVHAQSMLSTGFFTPHIEFPWKNEEGFAVWRNPLKKEFPITLKQLPGLPPELRTGFVGVHVFPCHIILLSPENMLYYKVLPRSESHFHLEVRDYILPEVAEDPAFETTLAERRVGMEYVHVQEDTPAVEGAQAGVRSRLFEQGYLSPDERPLWQFYNYLTSKVLEGVDNER